MTTMKTACLPLELVEAFVPLAEKERVSEVARSPRGFLTHYRWAQGKLTDPEWISRRRAFIARHMAQVTMRREPLFDARGRPSRRHLALIMWAYSPTPDALMDVKENQ